MYRMIRLDSKGNILSVSPHLGEYAVSSPFPGTEGETIEILELVKEYVIVPQTYPDERLESFKER